MPTPQQVLLRLAVKRDLNVVRRRAAADAPGIAIEGVRRWRESHGLPVCEPDRGTQAGEIAARLVGVPRKFCERSSSRSGSVDAEGHVLGRAAYHRQALGIDLSAQPQNDLRQTAVVEFTTASVIPPLAAPLSSTFRSHPASAITRACHSQRDHARDGKRGRLRTLAEPNLTAIFGEGRRRFLAGGEFPRPAAIPCDNTTHVCTEHPYQLKEIRHLANYFHAGRSLRRPDQPAGATRVSALLRQRNHGDPDRSVPPASTPSPSPRSTPSGNHPVEFLGGLDGDGPAA